MSWSERMRSRWDTRMQGRTGEVPLGEPVTVTYEVFVGRSAQAVWDALQDPNALLLPGDALKRVEHVAGTGPGLGRQLTLYYEDGRPDLHVLTVVAEFPPVHLDEVVETAPGQRYRVRTWIEHTGAGCRVRWQADYPCPAHASEDARSQFAGRMREVGLQHGERLKRLLETGSL